MNEEKIEKDRFGLKKLTIDQEISISFLLFILGNMLVLSALIPLSRMNDLLPAFLGLLISATGYTFALESIRELEEKDHFISRVLENRNS
jgi:hypothetical protein